MFRAWDSASPIETGSCVHLSPRSPSRGAGTDLLLSYEEVWPGTLAQSIILGSEESVLDGNTPTIAHCVLAMYTQLSPTLAAPPPTNPAILDIVQQAQNLGIHPGEFDIYTDG